MQYRSVHVTAVFPAHDTYKSSILRLRLRAAAAADAPSYAVCRLPAMWRRRRRPSPRLAPLLRQCRPKHGLETPPSLSLSPLPPINPQPNPIKHSLTGCRNPPPSPPPRPTLPFPPSPSSLPPLLLLRSPSPRPPPLFPATGLPSHGNFMSAAQNGLAQGSEEVEGQRRGQRSRALIS